MQGNEPANIPPYEKIDTKRIERHLIIPRVDNLNNWIRETRVNGGRGQNKLFPFLHRRQTRVPIMNYQFLHVFAHKLADRTVNFLIIEWSRSEAIFLIEVVDDWEDDIVDKVSSFYENA